MAPPSSSSDDFPQVIDADVSIDDRDKMIQISQEIEPEGHFETVANDAQGSSHDSVPASCSQEDDESKEQDVADEHAVVNAEM